MKVSCPSCQTNYNIDDKRIPPGGAKLKCARCQNTFPIKADEPVSTPAPAAVPLPGPTAPQAAPFAAHDDFQQPPEAAATRVVALPVPSAAYRDNAAPPTAEAIPLPGAAAPSTGYADTASDFDYNASGSAPAGGAIPLPGASDGYPGHFDQAADPYAAAPPADAVALPPPPSDDPYAADPYATAPQADAIALPPPPSGNPYASPGADDSFLASHQPTTAEVDTFPLTSPSAGDPYAAAEADDPFGLPPPVASEADPFGLPPPAEEPYAAVEADDPFGLPPPPAEEPYAAVEADDPFGLPPPPADVTNLDFSEPPSAAPSTVDVGLDFSESTEASIPDALEFDPSRSGSGDLEADLSAPPPPGPGTADGLEMLSFVDDAAKDSGANAHRFHVRRRSGKVFGPFEEGVVVKMLEDGQLLGNEDVSNDGDTWTPIGTVPTFAAAIQKLMEGSGTPSAPAAAPPVPGAEPGSKTGQPSAAGMEKLQQMYGGRMAPVAVTDSTSKLELFLAKVKKRLPLVIAAAAVLVVLIVGLSFSTTRYGAFGLKKFFPAQVEDSTDVEAARKALLQDSFQSYKQARTLTDKVLAADEYPEVRAIWCQAVFYLQRRYSAAEGADLARCRSEEEAASLELLGEKNVEYVKYLAGSALAAGDANTAIQLLQDAWSRDSNQGDVELGLLLAEAQTFQKKDNVQAIDTLKRVLQTQPDLAKAHHALGNIYQAGGKAEEAAKAYEAALKADATHITSAVELAAVELLLRKDAQKGLEASERALDEKLQPQMGQAELSRARTLKGVALFQLSQLEDAEKELRAALEKDSKSLILQSYLARVLQTRRQFQEALPFHEAVAKAEPQNTEAMVGYISALVTLGKMEDAQKLVVEATKRFKDNARLAYLHGRIDEARDSNTSAEEHYKRALKADDKLVEAHVALGRLSLRLRRNDQAKEQFEAASAKASDNALVQLGLGELALAEGDNARAREAFERAVGLDAHLADAHLGLSRLALLAGDLAKAQKEADTALEMDPHTLRGGRLHRGTVLWRQGKLDDAATELEQAKKQEPRSVGILITLGAVYFDKSNAAREAKKETEATNGFKEAEVNLMLALKSEPSNAEANFYMAQVKAAQERLAQEKVASGKAPQGKEGRGDFNQALENMRTAVERAPKRADYRYAFGVLYRDAKQLPEAIEQWKEAVKLEPKMADAHEALGQAHLTRNEFNEAITSFQAALKAEPKRSQAHAFIGDAYFNALRWREAIRAYEQALKANPGRTTVFHKLGRAWSELNQHAKAIDWYVKATAANPDNADAWHDLGYAYKEKGKKKEAVKAFQEYLTRKPEAENRKEIEDEITFLE
ncbi:tetratricopeptide repeat protein [Archangium sp.]|uniref:tetratricopeptide repeat protein n=1 Tax=Archangium sp. TaxID=1872627 RepID=UPI002D4747E6|nr:tetratricopeptide repeat protein [Archangium sp.]HYO55659.1 tetratricopeptide repeat protein [Archangium sp.]